MNNLTMFMEKASNKVLLQNELRNALHHVEPLEAAPRFIEVAGANGFVISESDMISHFFKRDESGSISILSNESLENVAGGKIKDTEDKEWWEYVVDTIDAIAKGAGRCFTGESLVSTPDGPKAIKDVKAGDEVISLDKDGSKRVAKVTDVIAPFEKPVWEVTFTDGHKWNTTETQWFYCGGDAFGCVMDDKGAQALTQDGQKAGIASVAATGRSELVYDLIVEGLNVMFVNGVAAEGFSLS